MKEQRFKELLLFDSLNIRNVVGLVFSWMFGLVGFSVWLIGLLVGKQLKK